MSFKDKLLAKLGLPAVDGGLKSSFTHESVSPNLNKEKKDKKTALLLNN